MSKYLESITCSDAGRLKTLGVPVVIGGDNVLPGSGITVSTVVEHHGKILKSFTGVLLRADLLNRAWPSKTIFQKRVGCPWPVRSALKRTRMQDFGSFSIIFY